MHPHLTGVSGRMPTDTDAFLRHIEACHSARLPGSRLPLRLTKQVVGWVEPPIADALARLGARFLPDAVDLNDPAALPKAARALADEGLLRWRNEAFDVRATPDGPVLSQVDRGALPVLGIAAIGVHMNGLVRRPDGLHVWVARRARSKHLDPGKLDHLVAGGVPAGLSPYAALLKEAAEEAAIPAALAGQAREVAVLDYAMDRQEGLRRDRLVCYDLDLPEDFRPIAADGEVEGFELWPLARAYQAVRDTDDFKFNVNLVLIDLFLRTGLIDPAGPDGQRLRAALSRGEAET